MVSLEDWAALERDHVSSLVGAIADLEANTLRLPATGGTKVYIYIYCYYCEYSWKLNPEDEEYSYHLELLFLQADVESLKAAMSSALDVMQAMGSSIWSLLSKVKTLLINLFSKSILLT